MSKSSLYVDANNIIHIINDNISHSGFITHNQPTVQSIWRIHVGNYIGDILCNVYINSENGLIYFPDYTAEIDNTTLIITFSNSYSGVATILICNNDLDDDTPI